MEPGPEEQKAIAWVKAQQAKGLVSIDITTDWLVSCMENTKNFLAPTRPQPTREEAFRDFNEFNAAIDAGRIRRLTPEDFGEPAVGSAGASPVL